MPRYYFFLVLCICISGPAIASTTSSQPFTLRIITEEWAPYNYMEKGVLKGFSVEIVRAVMKQLGEEHKIELLPGARGERLLDYEPNVMNFSLFRTREREPRYKWIGPISEESIYFYKLADNHKTYGDIQQIKKIAIASPTRGWFFLGLSNSDSATCVKRLTGSSDLNCCWPQRWSF
ncbi:substrate-binding periplasmic protein [Dongshaea marina]|uniref:substrate-binding periplasmic protein n=1 Tax=Dongshaea marina TaxID=2047966 RepID=UPI000D3E78E2|nr:transporter substrate-binding domain-containing protein [Dongshaea marina]